MAYIFDSVIVNVTVEGFPGSLSFCYNLHHVYFR